MDWLLAPATAEAGSALRAELGRYLRRHATDLDQAWTAELAASELIANAVAHAGGPVWVSLDWAGPHPVVTVHDLGPTFALDLSTPDVGGDCGRGLWLVSQIAGDLAVAAKRTGGKRVSATLAVTRRPRPPLEASQRPLEPPRRPVDPQPDLAEAGNEGFGREVFLRALVVELARTVERTQGPTIAEEVISHVGNTIGAQMEREYRAARAVTDRLTPKQIADCYVRLKAAIEGDFYVIEASTDRIVMGNRRCPFGHTVRHSPALCQVTSSVFGGIAARNTGQALVRTDERIAVGDPECRVTILLRAEEVHAARRGHRYQDDDTTPTNDNATPTRPVPA